MLLYLEAKLKELRQTPREFFETAYYARFGKPYNAMPDVLQFQDGTIPKHVVEFLKDMQRAE